MRRDVSIAIALLLLGGAIHLLLTDFFLHRVHATGVAERTEGQYRKLHDSVRTLVLGNSHAKWGLLASELDGGFNLAIGGQTASETYYVLEEVLEDPPPGLHTLILPAEALTFSSWQAHRFGIRHWYAWRVDYAAIGWDRGEPFRYALNGWLGRYAPYVGRRNEILLHLSSALHAEQRMERGSMLAEGSWEETTPAEREEKARDRAATHFPVAEFDEVAARYFRRTLARAREAGLRVLLVRFPVSTEYLRATRPFRDAVRIDERLGEILADFPEVALLDARMNFGDVPRLFVDPDHMNQHGARRLARLVRRTLEQGPAGPAGR